MINDEEEQRTTREAAGPPARSSSSSVGCMPMVLDSLRFLSVADGASASALSLVSPLLFRLALRQGLSHQDIKDYPQRTTAPLLGRASASMLDILPTLKRQGYEDPSPPAAADGDSGGDKEEEGVGVSGDQKEPQRFCVSLTLQSSPSSSSSPVDHQSSSQALVVQFGSPRLMLPVGSGNREIVFSWLTTHFRRCSRFVSTLLRVDATTDGLPFIDLHLSVVLSRQGDDDLALQAVKSLVDILRREEDDLLCHDDDDSGNTHIRTSGGSAPVPRITQLFSNQPDRVLTFLANTCALGLPSVRSPVAYIDCVGYCVQTSLQSSSPPLSSPRNTTFRGIRVVADTLQALHFDGTTTSSLAGISCCCRLRVLSVGGTFITDADIILVSRLVHLEELLMPHCMEVTSLNPLATNAVQRKLHTLDARFCKSLVSIRCVSKSSSLTVLRISSHSPHQQTQLNALLQGGTSGCHLRLLDVSTANEFSLVVHASSSPSASQLSAASPRSKVSPTGTVYDRLRELKLSAIAKQIFLPTMKMLPADSLVSLHVTDCDFLTSEAELTELLQTRLCSLSTIVLRNIRSAWFTVSPMTFAWLLPRNQDVGDETLLVFGSTSKCERQGLRVWEKVIVAGVMRPKTEDIVRSLQLRGKHIPSFSIRWI